MTNVPHRVELASQSIEWLEYDSQDRLLQVRFRGDGRYRYFDVPPQVIIDLLEAESTGAWFNQHFKEYGFDYQRLE